MAEYTTYSCRHCTPKPRGRRRIRRLRPIYKRRSNEKLYPLIRNMVVKYDFNKVIYAETIAKRLQVKVHQVKQIFMILNQEGLLSQGENLAPHDSTREKFGFGSDNSWCATRYYRRSK